MVPLQLLLAHKFAGGYGHCAHALLTGSAHTAASAAADVPEVAEGIYEKLRTQWLKLQKHSDEVRNSSVWFRC
jgi:hypothetical protein